MDQRRMQQHLNKMDYNKPQRQASLSQGLVAPGHYELGRPLRQPPGHERAPPIFVRPFDERRGRQSGRATRVPTASASETVFPAQIGGFSEPYDDQAQIPQAQRGPIQSNGNIEPRWMFIPERQPNADHSFSAQENPDRRESSSDAPLKSRKRRKVVQPSLPLGGFPPPESPVGLPSRYPEGEASSSSLAVLTASPELIPLIPRPASSQVSQQISPLQSEADKLAKKAEDARLISFVEDMALERARIMTRKASERVNVAKARVRELETAQEVIKQESRDRLKTVQRESDDKLEAVEQEHLNATEAQKKHYEEAMKTMENQHQEHIMAREERSCNLMNEKKEESIKHEKAVEALYAARKLLDEERVHHEQAIESSAKATESMQKELEKEKTSNRKALDLAKMKLEEEKSKHKETKERSAEARSTAERRSKEQKIRYKHDMEDSAEALHTVQKELRDEKSKHGDTKERSNEARNTAKRGWEEQDANHKIAMQDAAEALHAVQKEREALRGELNALKESKTELMQGMMALVEKFKRSDTPLTTLEDKESGNNVSEGITTRRIVESERERAAKGGAKRGLGS